jgi:hypothetical protein
MREIMTEESKIPIVRPVPTEVQTAKNLSVEIESGQPWPGVYRGSKYSLVKGADGYRLYTSDHRLDISGQVPQNLPELLTNLNKSGGKGTGSFLITAKGDVITKINSDNYEKADDYYVSEGWIPVYVGKLDGDIGFVGLENDPSDPSIVWEGLCFSHGERWSLSYEEGIEWRYKDFHFKSVNDHEELVSALRKARPKGGRFRVNEHGHIWVEVPRDSPRRGGKFEKGIKEWFEKARDSNQERLLNVIHLRLEATGGGDPDEGTLPIYAGHVSNYDAGNPPVPYINDRKYYKEVTREEKDSTGIHD